jgi:hypothetical protein
LAQQVSVVLVDDLDGSTAAETVSFGLDGRSYELDLSTDNAAKLRDALAPFAAAARRAGKGTRQRLARAVRSATNRDKSVAIREWARANGHQVSDRGRISASVVQAYNESNAKPAAG